MARTTLEGEPLGDKLRNAGAQVRWAVEQGGILVGNGIIVALESVAKKLVRRSR